MRYRLLIGGDKPTRYMIGGVTNLNFELEQSGGYKHNWIKLTREGKEKIITWKNTGGVKLADVSINPTDDINDANIKLVLIENGDPIANGILQLPFNIKDFIKNNNQVTQEEGAETDEALSGNERDNGQQDYDQQVYSTNIDFYIHDPDKILIHHLGHDYLISVPLSPGNTNLDLNNSNILKKSTIGVTEIFNLIANNVKNTKFISELKQYVTSIQTPQEHNSEEEVE